ncbi:MAG: proline dehydrogenase family protein [Acidobacteriota bacterium]|nr:proline dehydrogenase family protein [Acidobacteriota bacterium]MDQ7086398.1 proline dehydrogenase family protein [Acidobacteriota bacterium]
MGRSKALLVRLLKASPRPLVWRFARRYIAGDRLDHAVEVVRRLEREGCRATVDVLGEDVTRESDVEAYVEEYHQAIERIVAEGLDANVSIKPTAFGLRISEALCYRALRSVLEKADEHGMFVRLDMEDSPTTQATLDLYRRLRSEGFERLGVVLQSYLRRTLDDVRTLAAEGASVRLCKGIYVEPRELAYKEYQLIREAYVDALEVLLRGEDTHTAIATHDDYLVFHGRRLVRELGLGPGRYEFQMLLGVDEQLRRLLVAEGHPLRVYVPYGRGWHGYSLRRLVENPHLAAHVVRNVLGFGIGSEKAAPR